MSITTALSLETLSPDELFATSERDLKELWIYYDSNNNGFLELDEFTLLITDVLDRMQAQLPAQIPAKYCAEYHLAPSVLEGVEGRILDRFKGISRTVIARKLFDELDPQQLGYIEPTKLVSLHELMEVHVLKDLYDFIGQIMIQKQMAHFDKVYQAQDSSNHPQPSPDPPTLINSSSMEPKSPTLELKTVGTAFAKKSGLSSYGSLYRDVLQSIFHFLDLNPFVGACRVNQSSPFWSLPTQLRELTLQFNCWMFRKPETAPTISLLSPYLSTCMKEIATNLSCLVKLDIKLWNGAGEIDCPSEVQTISTITDLSFPKQFRLNQTIDLINSMPALRRLRTPDIWTSDSLQHLADGFNEAHSPHLEDIDYLTVDEPFAHQLKRVVALTRCHLLMSLPDPTILVPHLPHLSHLKLVCFDTVKGDLLASALSSCIHLVTLEVKHRRLWSEHVNQFLPHLKSLSELRFECCRSLDSLQFLTSARTSLTLLHTFVIHGSSNMPLKEYDHLQSIAPTLEYLTIEGTTIGRWTPNSDEFCTEDWPRLKEFKLQQLDWVL